MDYLYTREEKDWGANFTPIDQTQTVEALEGGQVVYFPQLAFDVMESEVPYISPQSLQEGVKNISLDPRTQSVKGIAGSDEATHHLESLVKRYAIHARQLVENLFPAYAPHLIQGRTSYRPAEVAGRISSYRKDDTRLHVDAFPSSPNQGKRLLRVFANINLEGKPRVWRLGEPFENVATRFLPQIPAPLPGAAVLLNMLGITKTRRTAYDHYMLQLHDRMKADLDYQKNVSQLTFEFPPATTWIVMTDQASHAAMAGQHMLEQTFYLPVEGMVNPETSPLRILERLKSQILI